MAGKQTHKLRGLSNVAAVVAGAPSLAAAAKTLGVNRSTLYRWVQGGKVEKPAAKEGPAAGAEPGQSPQAWAAAVRALGELDATRSALVDLAMAALVMARDPEARRETQLAAMGRYQQLVKQLNLAVETTVGAGQPPARSFIPRAVRAGADPRGVLMAVK